MYLKSVASSYSLAGHFQGPISPNSLISGNSPPHRRTTMIPCFFSFFFLSVSMGVQINRGKTTVPGSIEPPLCRLPYKNPILCAAAMALMLCAARSGSGPGLCSELRLEFCHSPTDILALNNRSRSPAGGSVYGNTREVAPCPPRPNAGEKQRVQHITYQVILCA